jgi:hypothetical protein
MVEPASCRKSVKPGRSLSGLMPALGSHLPRADAASASPPRFRAKSADACPWSVVSLLSMKRRLDGSETVAGPSRGPRAL